MNSYKGKLLISDPNMIDPNFKRSVILVTNHDKKESVGLILNQPTKVKINDESLVNAFLKPLITDVTS